MFCTGAAPTRPGISARFSSPGQPCCSVQATNSCQFSPAPASTTTHAARSSNPAPAVVNAAGISEETNFDAVSAQRSIQDDAARRETLRSQYQVVQPTAVPTRNGASGPNIVDYALSTTHAVGTGMYSRLKLAAGQRYDRNCAKYPSADLAQQDFLLRGGPKTDRMGLDPDGDGFACSWDPSPFRRARSG